MSLYLISAGHGNRDPGASNIRLGLLEHLEAYKVVWHLRKALEAQGHAVDFISCFQPLGEKIAAVNRRAEESQVEAAIEVHFNSAESNEAHGTEVLHFSAERRAQLVSARLARALGTLDRGAKRRTDLGWLTHTRPVAFIIEALFINNDDEATLINEKNFHQRAAKAIADALTEPLT